MRSQQIRNEIRNEIRRYVWPAWFPYPSSWCNALILSLLLTGFAVILRVTGGLGSNIAQLVRNPELYIVSLIFLLILPIPLIAIVHHFLLISFIPILSKGRKIKNLGFFPGVVSWWSGFYSWFVFVFSTLIATLFCTIIFPLFQLNYQRFIYQSGAKHIDIQAMFALLWLISAAILYQVQYLARQSFISQDLVAIEPEIISPEPTRFTNIQQNTQAIRDDVVYTENKPKKSPIYIGNIIGKVINRKLPKRLFFLIFIPVVAAWLYSFVNLPGVKESISAENFIIENPLQNAQPSSSAASAKFELSENDAFKQALNLGDMATDLAKVAGTKGEWRAVAGQWKAAISLLKTISTDSPNYVFAEVKIAEFQKSLEVAQKNAESAK